MAADEVGQDFDNQLDLMVARSPFYNTEKPFEFWNVIQLQELARQSNAGLMQYQLVEAAIKLVGFKIDSWVKGIDGKQEIDFFCSEEFIQFIIGTAAYPFHENVSNYIEDVDKGWIVRHISLYLVGAYLKLHPDDSRNATFLPKIQQIARLIISLWSEQYVSMLSLKVKWKDITDSDSNLDMQKATYVLERLFDAKTSDAVSSLFETARAMQGSSIEG